MASTISLHATGLRTPCCLTLFVFFLATTSFTDAAVQSAEGKCSFFAAHTKGGLFFHFRACCKLKDLSEGIGERKEGM